jgi:hypothetical protein
MGFGFCFIPPHFLQCIEVLTLSGFEVKVTPNHSPLFGGQKIFLARPLHFYYRV